MSKRIGNLAILDAEPSMICSHCGKIAEVRPYGPGGSEICHDCASATPEMNAIVDHNMGIKLFGDKGELR